MSSKMNVGSNNNNNGEVLSWRSAISQTVAVSVKNIVLLGYGMTLGFPTLLIPILSGHDKDETFHLGDEGISWIGSISLICVPFGCFFSGMLTQPFGRRRSMQFINIPFFCSWLLFYFSSEIWHVFAALALAGLAGGLMEAPVLTYVAEVTQPQLRGMLSSTSSMAVIAGSMIQFILATFLKWRTQALCSAIVPIISLTLLFFIPETPLWLLSKKRFEEAKKSLAWLRGWVTIEEVDKEYKELADQVITSRGIGNSGFEDENEKNLNGLDNKVDKTSSEVVPFRKRTKAETLRLFKKRNFLRPYALVSFIFFLSHFNGFSPVQTYAVNIFTSLEAPIDKYYATALLGVVELFGCILCVSLVHQVGKRIITFFSLFGTAVCLIIVGVYSHPYHITKLSKSEVNNTIIISTTNQIEPQERFTWIPMVAIITGAFLCHMGIRILPWILTGEVFPNETRAIASGIAATSFYIFGFFCNKIFLYMVSTLTLSGTFCFFSAISFMGLVVLYFVLPETEGKSLQDITAHFSGRLKLGNHVQRGRKNVVGMDNEGFDGDKKKNKNNVESTF